MDSTPPSKPVSDVILLPTPAPLLISQDSPTPPNPWSDAADSDRSKALESEIERPLHTPDPELLDQSITSGLEAVESPMDPKPRVSAEVLNEFDPLANSEEEAARKAWETSEAHPPPPRTPSPPVPTLAIKDFVASSPDSPMSSGSLSASNFPSLAALARTFSIPALSRPRPLSLDTAKPVPSPATLSSLATQQDAARATLTTTATTSTGFNSHPSTPGGSGTTSPVSGSREKTDIPFDFQNFLDQMKSRSAEPVSKYLRSYVILVMRFCLT